MTALHIAVLNALRNEPMRPTSRDMSDVCYELMLEDLVKIQLPEQTFALTEFGRQALEKALASV